MTKIILRRISKRNIISTHLPQRVLLLLSKTSRVFCRIRYFFSPDIRKVYSFFCVHSKTTVLAKTREMAQYFFCFFKEICHDTHFSAPIKTARKHFQNRFPWEQKIWCALSVEHVRRKYFLHRIFISADRDFMSATARKNQRHQRKKKLLQQQNHQKRLLRSEVTLAWQRVAQ